jgi:hypothetical protein
MNWTLFRAALVNEHSSSQQDVATIDHALRLVQDGLLLLARFGHVYHLAEGRGETTEWPRMLFHSVKAPRGHLTLCDEDFELMGGHEGGWFNTLAEAQHAEAFGFQYRRGGIIPKRGLPVIVNGEALTPLDRKRMAEGEM